MKILLSFLAVLLQINFVLLLELPKSFKRCKVSPETDNKPNECLKTAINEALIQLKEGNKDVDIPKLDPLKINKINILRGNTDAPISILLNFFDNDLRGLSSAYISSISGKLSSPKNFELRLNYFIENSSMVGPYNMNGRMFLIPVNGQGISTVFLYNTTGNVTIKGSRQVKDNEEYVKIKDLKMDFDSEQFVIHLTNLFNGNKLLGDAMNRLMNENWRQSFDELRIPSVRAFGAVLKDFTKTIFERIAFKDIFLLDES